MLPLLGKTTWLSAMCLCALLQSNNSQGNWQKDNFTLCLSALWLYLKTLGLCNWLTWPMHVLQKVIQLVYMMTREAGIYTIHLHCTMVIDSGGVHIWAVYPFCVLSIFLVCRWHIAHCRNKSRDNHTSLKYFKIISSVKEIQSAIQMLLDNLHERRNPSLDHTRIKRCVENVLVMYDKFAAIASGYISYIYEHF